MKVVDWRDVLSNSNLDESVALFVQKFKNILDLHAPEVKFQERTNYNIYLSDQTKNLMKERDALKHKFKSTSDSDQKKTVWRSYKVLRNKVNNLKRNDEFKFKSDALITDSASSDKTWRTIKQFMDWSTPATPREIDDNGIILRKSKDLANYMNNFFTTKVHKLKSKINKVTFSDVSCAKIMENKTCKLNLEFVPEFKIRKIIKGLKNSKCASVDSLDSYSLKIAADQISKPIHHIITLALMQNKFPTAWKIAKIIPLHKKNELNLAKNYRPVSILSPLSKVLEKIMYEQIYEYFSTQNLFHPNIHGFRKNRSTQTILLQMYNRWLEASNTGDVSGIVLLDLSAAFDLVNPDLLLQKLSMYKLSDDYLELLESYLKDRWQAVWIDHLFSDYANINVGVPQGSLMGPLLFNIFINDLLSSVSCNIECYADDSTLTKQGNSSDLVSTDLTSNCNIVSDWMAGNQFVLNADKTHLMLMGTSLKLKNEPQLKVKMDNLELIQTTSENVLGCYIDNNLKWKSQINYLCRKLMQRIACLSQLKFVRSFKPRKMIANGLFNSVLMYCMPVWGGCDIQDINRLQILQNRAVQLVTKHPPRTHRNIMFDKIDWLTVRQMVVYTTLLAVFKIRKSGEPELLAVKLRRESRNGRIMIENTKLQTVQDGFVYRGSTQWNMLPNTIKILQENKFKVELKQWVRSNISRF